MTDAAEGDKPPTAFLFWDVLLRSMRGNHHRAEKRNIRSYEASYRFVERSPRIDSRSPDGPRRILPNAVSSPNEARLKQGPSIQVRYPSKAHLPQSPTPQTVWRSTQTMILSGEVSFLSKAAAATIIGSGPEL